jgi:hypothetical protein
VEDEALYELIRYWKLRALYYEALYRIRGGSLDPFCVCGSGETEATDRPGCLPGDGRLFKLPGSKRPGILQ